MSTYGAFVSYSHAEDRGVAVRLRDGVERFAKPWYRQRALRLFLDVNSLSADPGLWSSIEKALSESEWFVLVTSPRAAKSVWVDKEIRWWLEHRSPDRLLIVVAEGELRWDAAAGEFDAAASDALPPALIGALGEEPRWVNVAPDPDGGPEPSDTDMQAAVVDVAAAIRGIPKEDLEGVAVREHRRTRRWVTGAIAVLTVLLVAAVVASVVALEERGSAIGQARLAQSRQIATVSEQAAGSDLNIAMQLAVHAYRTEPNPQTRAALINASTASPRLVRFLDAGAAVTQLAGSSDGEVAVAGLADGRVLSWPILTALPEELFRLRKPVSSIAVSADGDLVVASDGSQCRLWDRARGRALLLSLPGEGRCGAAGISPSGRTVVYALDVTDSMDELIAVAPSDDLAARELHPISIFNNVDRIMVPSDRRALISSPGDWQWRRFSDWSGSEGRVGIGAHTLAHLFSSDGRYAIVTSGERLVPVWRTEPGADLLEPDFRVEVPLPDQNALALSPDGAKLAVAGNGQIYVTPTRRGEADPEAASLANQPVTLTGEKAGVVSFVGDERLLSAAGSEIAIWDVEQLDRLARIQSVPLEAGCTLCAPPRLAISPDGEQLAVLAGFENAGFVQSLTGQPARELLPTGPGAYGAPLWGPDGKAAFPLWDKYGEGEQLASGECPTACRFWPVGDTEEGARELSSAIAPDGETAILVDSDAGVHWQSLSSGERTDYSDSQLPDLSEDVPTKSAAISGSGRFLAFAVGGTVKVEKLPGRQLVGRIPTSPEAGVSYAGEHLLVQLDDGRLQIWNERGTELLRTLPGNGYAWLVPSVDGTMVARAGNDGRVSVADVESGTELGTFRTPDENGSIKTGLAFSPDGRLLAALSEQLSSANRGILVLRDISEQNLIRTACAAVGPELTAEQWRAFIGTDPPGDLSCEG